MEAHAPFLTYRHPVEGEMSFSVVGNTVRFSCRWPFDRATDDWIAIQNEFEREPYRRGALDLPNARTVRIEGRSSGHVEFTLLSENQVKMDVRDSAAERPSRLVCVLRLSAADLAPGGQPKSFTD